MRTKLCAELGTNHHGDVSLALEMIHAAAEAGCSAVKIQHYGAVNPRDPQSVWLDESRLPASNIEVLRDLARGLGLEFWATPFHSDALHDLLSIGVTRIKIASSDVRSSWLEMLQLPAGTVLSWPWGKALNRSNQWIHLTAIPLYPTPLECVYRAPLLDGWSDHTIGLAACQYMIAQGAQWIEAHLKLPGKTRERDFEKPPDDFKILRQFAEDVETMRTGVGEIFRNRWLK